MKLNDGGGKGQLPYVQPRQTAIGIFGIVSQ